MPEPGISPERRIHDSATDTVSAVRFCPSQSNGRLLMVSSWDGVVRIHDTEQNVKRHQFEIGEPVLDCCFSVSVHKYYKVIGINFHVFFCIERMLHMHFVGDWITT